MQSCGGLVLHMDDNGVISNETGRCKGFFLGFLLESNTLLRRRRDCVCFWSFCSSAFTLKCSAFDAHPRGVAHQSSLRSRSTTMSFSISPFREAGSLITQPVTFSPNAVLASPHGHHHLSAASVHDDRTRCTQSDPAT